MTCRGVTERAANSRLGGHRGGRSSGRSAGWTGVATARRGARPLGARLAPPPPLSVFRRRGTEAMYLTGGPICCSFHDER